MRPVALHIEGFGVFRDPVTLSFDGVEYFALVGATGAGKSTVIDAICFALYGSVPRYDDERLVGRVVSVGKQEAKVSLTFVLDHRTYRATRVVRVRDGKATTPEALLEDVTSGEGPSHLLASRAREMKPAVERLLGLPFPHFTRCVVLPQGDFAQFLHDEPASRQKLLSNLLGLDVYKEIGQRARDRAAAAKRSVEVHEQQAASLAFATEAARDQAGRQRRVLLELHKRVDAARRDDAQLAAVLRDAGAREAGSARAVEQLATVKRPAGIDALATAISSARAALAASADASAGAATELARLDAAVAALPDQAALLRARAAHDEIDGLRTAGAALVEELEAADRAVADAAADAAATEATLADARTALDVARVAHAAHDLRAHLVAGEPCPVCEQPVTAVPKGKRPAALTGAERAVKRAEQTAERARGVLTTATNRRTVVATRAEQCKTRLDDLIAALVEHPDRAPVDAGLEQIERVRAEHARARQVDQEARAAQSERRKEEERAVAQGARAAHALQERREALLRAGIEPPVPGDDLAHAWSVLVDWAAGARREYEEAGAEARSEVERVTSERRQTCRELVDRARDLGVPGDLETDLPALADLIVQHGTNAANELQRIDDAIEGARAAREAASTARAEFDVADLLATHMRADRFERWLLVEALELLVERASETLLALSDHQYSLQYRDEEFVVVDHRNADATRSVRTLSGGETFQASLALALALSDQLAALSGGTGAKLDAIFLDEGFGTLDADALEVVAETIETLGTAGRMVGLVTHVPALAERVPVRYRVIRAENSATVTREDA